MNCFRDDLLPMKRRLLFALLQRYSLAVDTLAYPVPQGFSSFFTYLTYRSLCYERFIQYIQANALQLQIDVMRLILSGMTLLWIFFKKIHFIVIIIKL